VSLGLTLAVSVTQSSHASTLTPDSTRWIAVYAGGPHRPSYTVRDFVTLLAVVDTAGTPTAWLCDGALFVEFQAVSGHVYVRRGSDWLADGADWSAILDSLFSAGGPVARLDSAVALLDAQVGTLGHPFRVSFLLPHPPSPSLKFLDKIFRTDTLPGLVSAVSAYATEVGRRFHRSYRHLELDAFQWGDEGMLPSDTALVVGVGQEVHKLGKRFLWVPAFGVRRATDWRVFGFDDAWLQPNYFFHPDVPATRLDTAFALARAAKMGVELEFDRRMFGPPEFSDRLEPYLTAFESAPDLRVRSIVIYEGAGALLILARSRDEWHRDLYHRLVAALQPLPAYVAHQ